MEYQEYLQEPTEVDELIKGHHNNYKEYLQKKRKMARAIKSTKDLDFVNREYFFRREISKLLKEHHFLHVAWDGDDDVYTTWVWGGFNEDDHNDPYHDSHYCDYYEEAYERCLEYIKLGENRKNYLK
jgi:hypothetical protein